MIEDAKNTGQRNKVLHVFLIILFVAAFVIFCFSAVKLYQSWKRYHDADVEYSEIQENAMIMFEDAEEADDDPVLSEITGEESAADSNTIRIVSASTDSTTLPEFYIDFSYLQSLNREVIGWISIPDTQVDYPIAQTDDNEYYLHYSIMGDLDWIGCPFLDYRNSSDFSDLITYLYGHDLNNGAMFPDIKKYRDEEFYEENPYFYVFTPTKTLIYEVYATCTVDGYDGNAFRFYLTEESQQEVIDYCLSLADYETGVPVHAGDRLLTLVTCEDDRDYRFLVNAVLTDEIDAVH